MAKHTKVLVVDYSVYSINNKNYCRALDELSGPILGPVRQTGNEIILGT